MIKLRPHHGLCIQHFVGKGYSEEFVVEMTNVIQQLEQNELVQIQLTSSADVICKACPHNENGACKSGQKVIDYDNKCLALCELKDGDVLFWSEYKNLIFKSIIACDKLSLVCVDCQWIDICSSFTW